MLKRNLFIILSGVIAATAVLGWMPSLQCEWFPDSLVSSQGDTVETAVPSSDVSSHVRDELVQVLTSSIERLQGVVDEAQLPERLGGTLSVPHVRLMDPEVPPLIEPLPIVVSAESKANSALMSLSQAPGLSSAGLVAIADLAEGRILASAPSEGVQEILLEIRADEQFHRGARFRVSEFFLEALVWACVDDTRRICVISTFPVSLAAQGAEGCQMASESVRIQCDGKSLEGGKVFDAQGCSGAPPSEVVSIWRSIQSQTEASGRVSVKGQSYGYDKQAFGSDCHVTAFFPISAGTDSSGGPVVEKGLFTPFQMLIALVAGILVFCLGLVCTRRRREESQDGDAAQEDVSSSLKDKDEEAACLRASLSSSREEGLRLEKEVRRLETEKGNLDSKVTQLEEQLQFARQSYQKAQEASERPRAASTPVTPPSAIEHDRGQKQTESVASSGKGDSRDRLTEEVPEVTMASILTHDAPVAELTDVGVVPMPDELFPDDGWDEIAAGFDAILVDKRAETVSAKTDVGLSSLGMLEGASPEESSFGMTGFLNAVKKKENRLTRDMVLSQEGVKNTPTSLKSLTSQPKFSSIPSVGVSSRPSELQVKSVKPVPSLPSAPPKPRPVQQDLSESPGSSKSGGANFERGSLSGERSLFGHEHPMGAAELATRSPVKPESGTFKPAPSWTGTRVQDAVGMDQNTLLDALKRRAKDVSEMNMPAAEGDIKSGAFEFNRSLSRSGVFSLTGSRVDIDPLSDTEYFRSLYEKFIESQKACGETSDRFTLEQFMSRLAREKEQLIKTYMCKDVRFQVYVKDGKTSLKATPLK